MYTIPGTHRDFCILRKITICIHQVSYNEEMRKDRATSVIAIVSQLKSNDLIMPAFEEDEIHRNVYGLGNSSRSFLYYLFFS